jgi:hypothetical protein
VARAFALPVTHVSAEPVRPAARAVRDLAPIIDMNRPSNRLLRTPPPDQKDDDLPAEEQPPASEAM